MLLPPAQLQLAGAAITVRPTAPPLLHTQRTPHADEWTAQPQHGTCGSSRVSRARNTAATPASPAALAAPAALALSALPPSCFGVAVWARGALALLLPLLALMCCCIALHRAAAHLPASGHEMARRAAPPRVPLTLTKRCVRDD